MDREVLNMHTTHPDLVAIKTAVRHLAIRLENEAAATGHWASLSSHRGVPEVSTKLEHVIALLEQASREVKEAGDSLFDAQERMSAEDHHHHD